jgi:hypothetical protein
MEKTITAMERRPGIAGAVQYAVELTYPPTPDFPEPMVRNLIFTGTEYGAPGPVLMTFTDTMFSTHVDTPVRFGQTFDESWVRAFFANH